MRLSKIKLAGFKSFVDPTTLGFPGNLTGIVGPNGCGKSNVIDAVRWVMGELSARYLRGDSMADVVFNGSNTRKPVGAASVELIFDNADGKIGGPYASYNEVSLRRTVSRDGSSSYFINGARCRRKDITQLFLGTGLGSRSYAIIEQGTISRVVEAKADDMRSLLEEAAGISRYKERRRETESRIADTRENLERLEDLRGEVDKHIRHLQRQAATARRYQALKTEERRLAAQLLALKLRDLDAGTEVHDSATRERELAMQSALAEQRSAEAALERQREVHEQLTERVSGAQARNYEVGASIARTEQTLEHSRDLRERQRSDLEQARAATRELAGQIEHDARALEELRNALGRLAPQLADAQREEQAALRELEGAEGAFTQSEQRWEAFSAALGNASQTTQVEQARIEQLENERQRLAARADRIAVELEQLASKHTSSELEELSGVEGAARSRAEQLAESLSASLADLRRLRAEQVEAERDLEAARVDGERLRRELVSLEALQKAALTHDAGSAAEWLGERGLAERPRVAEMLEVQPGWERAVETALGDYLEAVCVEGLDGPAAALEGFAGGRLALIESAQTPSEERPPLAAAETLASKVIRGPAAVCRQLGGVLAGGSLAEALSRRASLAAGESIILASGEWVGREWLRVNRGADQHAGIIEREHRLKALRAQSETEEQRVAAVGERVASVRESLLEAERRRDRLQSEIQQAHEAHADVRGRLEAMRARSEESTARRARLREDAAHAAGEIATVEEALARARRALEEGLATVGELDASRPQLEAEREQRRDAAVGARARAQSTQLGARELIVRLESRRASESSMALALERALEQRSQLEARCGQLQGEIASAAQPIEEFEQRLNEQLAERVEVERDLASARRALEEADGELRAFDERRMVAEQRVHEAREAMEQARLAARETRVRREALAEQLAATGFELAQLQADLVADADPAQWDERLAQARSSIEKLGQVNLAAIGELDEQTERKAYLDRQLHDLTDALTTLEEAMRRIDKETRTRFEETFERINQGLKEKFPRLFGGGHAYLELVGEDVLSAGVTVMARPPGKRNSTIHLLSGGEKALTAVALVFSIFDLNPAPFCLLDEVDAPLDEYNIGRFCDIVREMSSRIQFLFITHNKATMELASQLVGVTMSEPGVSRLVTVDIDEAIRLAAV